MRLAPGRTAEDVVAFLRTPAGPPPFEPLGGFMMLDAGTSGWMKVDLAPGEYAAVCFVPDVSNQEADLHFGMYTQVTVGGSGAASPAPAPSGGDGGTHGAAAAPAPETAPSGPAHLPADGTVLSLATRDGLAFDRSEVTAPAGARVTLEYRNERPIPHNVHLFAGQDQRAPSLAATEIHPRSGRDDAPGVHDAERARPLPLPLRPPPADGRLARGAPTRARQSARHRRGRIGRPRRCYARRKTRALGARR